MVIESMNPLSAWRRTFPRTRVERLEEASVAKAQQLGRRSSRTEFFCFLDDDDEYLPGAVSMRLNELRADSSVDVVVTNGFERIVDNSYRMRAGASSNLHRRTRFERCCEKTGSPPAEVFFVRGP